MTEMEIICIGNELLIGKTANTNSQWISKRATNLGVVVRRITVVSDKVEEIAIVIKVIGNDILGTLVNF